MTIDKAVEDIVKLVGTPGAVVDGFIIILVGDDKALCMPTSFCAPTLTCIV